MKNYFWFKFYKIFISKFVINKKGKKVYLDRKTIAEGLKYTPKKSAKKA